MSTYIPFEHDKLRIDAIACERSIDATIRTMVEKETANLHAALVPWVGIANKIMELRTGPDKFSQPHWHWYSPGRIVVWTTLGRNESFADLHDIYEMASAHVEQIAPGYKTDKIVSRPEPDDTSAQQHGASDRSWKWEIGWRSFELIVSFHVSKYCRIVTETVTRPTEVHRVVCSDVIAIAQVAEW